MSKRTSRAIALGGLVAAVMTLAGPVSAQVTVVPADPTPSTTAPAAPIAPTVEPDAHATTEVGVASIDGVVGDDQDNALSGICVVFYAQGAWNGFAITGTDGTFGFTPAQPGAQQVAIFRPSTAGDCDAAPLAEGPVPEWYQDVALAFGDPRTAVPDANAGSVVDPSGLTICLGERTLYTGGCSPRVPQATGPGVISGRVVQAGDVPLAQACVFVLPQTSGGDGYPAITDADGRYSVTGLPIASYVIGVIPPFDIGQGPCRFDNGPPPIPPEGELQHEWYSNSWVDLAAAVNQPDVYSFAVAAGATPVTPDAVGIDLCLTADPATVVPRPPCSAVAGAISDPVLAFTGARDQTALVGLGAGAILLGAGLVFGAGRGRATRRRGARGRATAS